MKKRSPLPLVLLAVVGVVLSVLTPAAPAAARTVPESATSSELLQRRAPKPAQDFPRMPRSCATPKEKIPSKPVTCLLTPFDRDRPTVLLWGDSHSWMFIPALKAAVAGRGVNLVGVMMGSCPPMDNRVAVDDAVPACYRSNALGIEAARRLEATGQPYRVVLAGSWQRYVHARKVGDRSSYVGQMAQAMRRGTPRLARTLRSIGAEVDVIGQVATVPERHRRCAKGNLPYACQLPRGKALPEAGATRRYVVDVLRPLLGTRAPIDVNGRFCTASVCKGTVGTVRTWFDDLHLSATMSRTLAPYFRGTVEAVAPSSPEPQEPEGPSCPLPILC